MALKDAAKRFRITFPVFYDCVEKRCGSKG